jgi:hypothetical protein
VVLADETVECAILAIGIVLTAGCIHSAARADTILVAASRTGTLAA